jgi:hypothetical protein
MDRRNVIADEVFMPIYDNDLMNKMVRKQQHYAADVNAVQTS